jgi:hypothetical protein
LTPARADVQIVARPRLIKRTTVLLWAADWIGHLGVGTGSFGSNISTTNSPE